MPRGSKASESAHPAVDSADLSAENALTRGIARSIASKQEALAEEVNSIVDATLRVITRTGTVDPPLRDILIEAKLSTPAFYRHFSGKDELLVGMLQHGTRILVSYLAHRMSKVDDAADRIEEWIRGMLAQAADSNAARRSRPFVVNHRLALGFPIEYAAAEQSLIDLLVPPITELREGSDADVVRRDATAVYRLASTVQARHLRDESVPSERDADHLVELVLAALTR